VRDEVEARLGRSFESVQKQLTDHFGRDWDDVIVVIETASMKRERSQADVIVELVEKFEQRPSAQTRIKRSVVRWIGKPWRERENPWDRFKDRLPDPPTRRNEPVSDLDEWTPLRPDEE
jgi:hypothetical protein